MYYQNYEDYMRSVLGYPLENQNTYELYEPYGEEHYEMSQVYSNFGRYSNEIMDLYPEIYKIINPMVCKICDVNTKPITRDLIERMTDEIYLNLESQPESDTIVNVRVNTSNVTEKKNNTSTTNLRSKVKPEIEEKSYKESRQNRQNNTLRDLIRILILNRLLGGFPGNRPPNQRPPRPPMRPPYLRNDMYFNNNF